MSQRPRVKRNRDNSEVDLLRLARNAPVPVSRKKVGAQKWVIQRVKKSGIVVVAGSVGLMPEVPKKSRVWSSAIRIMITPRTMSTDSRRARFEATGATGSASVAIWRGSLAKKGSALHLLRR